MFKIQVTMRIVCVPALPRGRSTHLSYWPLFPLMVGLPFLACFSHLPILLTPSPPPPILPLGNAESSKIIRQI